MKDRNRSVLMMRRLCRKGARKATRALKLKTALLGVTMAASLACAPASIDGARTEPLDRPLRVELREGGIVRGPAGTRRIALVFTGHEFAEGADAILDALARRRARASFFLTGVFLRDPGKAEIAKRIVRDGHYIGPHSDAHLLYAPWTGPKVSLVSRETFTTDLTRNIEALKPFGVERDRVKYFLPAYEWYNEEIAQWTRAAGLTLICHTPGTRSTADYTEEGTPQFVSAEAIFQSILRREREDPNGLNGFILLLHIGAGPGRADKFHRRFGELIDILSKRGYAFVRVDALLEGVYAG